MIEAKEKSFPTILQAKNVTVDDGKLAWTLSTGPGSVYLDQLIFILDLPPQPNTASGYILCSLREDSDNKEKPYELTLVKTTNLPPALVKQYGVREIPSYLKHNASNAVNIIVSTKSGTGTSLQFWESVLEPLLKTAANEFNDITTGESYECLVTTSKDSVREFAQQLNTSDSKHHTVVFLSGDGGVVDLLNAYPGEATDGSHLTVAAMPLGSGNALFHSTHKPLYEPVGPSALVLGLRTLFTGVPADLPIFRATFSTGSRLVNFTEKDSSADDIQRQDTAVSELLGAIVASYGFHASIVYESDTPEYRVYGAKRFGMVAQELLRESHPYAARVEVRRPASDKFEPVPRETHAYVLSTLVSNLERTFTISPAGKPLDGKLRLVHFGAIGGERTMDVMMKAYDGGKHIDVKWDDGEAVGYEEIDELKVTTQEIDERWRKVCIDGTIVELAEGGSVTVKPEKALFKVVVDTKIASGKF